MAALNFIYEYGPLLMQGAFMTIQLWLCCMAVSLCVGLVWGLVRSNALRMTGVSSLLDVVTFVLRGIPFYVQLLIAYFVLPEFLGINLSPFAAALFALGLCSASYVSQIVRGGMNAIAQGQWEACFVLGLTKVQTIRYVMVPQLLRTILPMLTGELDQLLKTTSIVSAVGVMELTRVGLNIIARDMNPLPVYLAVAAMYLVASSVLTIVSGYLERRVCYVTR